MSRQPLPAPAFPPTPEDEASMAELHPGGGRAVSTQGITTTDPSQFSKVNSKVDSIVHSIVDTPTSPSSSFALSRFEFEPGKGNEGTKVLLVEWDSWATQSKTPEPPSTSGDARGQHTLQEHKKAAEDKWIISWEGKDSHNVLAAADDASDTDGAVRRVYFLLPPGALIPPLVSITCGSLGSEGDEGDGGNAGSEGEDGGVVLWTKPMPAIYPASLGPGVDEAGWRGVLHTLWAEQRLVGLAAEIEAEMKANSESIGLQIALQEQDWVSQHFGVGEHIGLRVNPPYLPSPESPAVRFAMPRSPIGGKLGEKLKGLRLATSPAELAAALQVKTAAPNTTRLTQAVDAPRPAVFGTRIGLHTSIEPHMGVHSSLDAVIQGGHAVDSNTILDGNVVDGEDELFALPLSPRSPEMARSPFSFL